MIFFKKLLIFFEGAMETPDIYGWFHIMFMLIILIASIIAVKLAKSASPKNTNIFLATVGTIMILFEVYKQIVFTFEVKNGAIVADYQWYIFPFQLCSTPMYIMLLSSIVKPGKVQEALHAYLAFFSLFAGVCVYFYPSGIFVATIGINIQTMIHHGSQIIVGCYLLSYYRNKLSLKLLFSSFLVFLTQVVIALSIDMIVPLFTTDYINMFFISPYHPTTLPVLNLIQPKLHSYFSFLMLYVLGFCFCASLVYSVTKTSIYLSYKIKGKTKSLKQIYKK